MTKTDEIIKKVADSFIAKIEAFDGEWERPFFKLNDEPRNIQSHKFYRGINTLILWLVAENNGYTSNVWGTFDQWKSKGYTIKKGEKGTQVIFYKPSKYNVEVTNDEGETELEEHQTLFVRYYTVFNICQMAEYEAPVIAETPKDVAEEVDEFCSEFLDKTGIEYNLGHPRACYVPMFDKVFLPSIDQFTDKSKFIPTACHEFIHATGAKNRLNRDFNNKFGEEAYAFEELVADIGAGFLSSALGKQYIFQNNNIAYLKSWVKILKEQPKAILKACSHAQKAADYLLDVAEVKSNVTEVLEKLDENNI